MKMSSNSSVYATVKYYLKHVLAITRYKYFAVIWSLVFEVVDASTEQLIL